MSLSVESNSEAIADVEVLQCLRSAVHAAKAEQIQTITALREKLTFNGFREHIISQALNLWGDYVRKDFANYK